MRSILKALIVAFVASTPTLVMAADDNSTPTAGFLEAYLSTSKYNYSSGSWDPFNSWRGGGLAGAISYPGSEGFTYGVDFRGLAAYSAEGSSSDSYSVYDLQFAGHLGMSQNDAAYGAFAGLAVTNGYYDAGGDTNIFGGIEAKLKLASSAAGSVQLGALRNVDSVWPYVGTVGFGEMELALFPAANIQITTALGGISGLIGDSAGERARTLTYRAEAALKMNDAPISLFASFSGYKDFASWRDEGVTPGNTISIGARFDFGGQDLSSQYMAVNRVMKLEAVSWLRLDAY